MGLAHQLDTDPGVQRLYSVAVEIWNPLRRRWEPKGIDTCHAWNSNDAAFKIRQAYPGQHVRIVSAGVTLGFFVKDNHGEELEV